MSLTHITYCKLCKQSNPAHAGFSHPSFESLPTDQKDSFGAKLEAHIRQHHPDVLAESTARSLIMYQFFILCAFDFTDKSAFAARDYLRWQLANMTRAYRLSDEKIADEVRGLEQSCSGREGDVRGPEVIELFKSLRDQLEEIGAWSQEQPAAENSLVLKP